jgi:hypothetical protein
MNKISRKIYVLFAFVFFVVSCNNMNKNENAVMNEDTVMNFIQIETEDTVIKQAYSNIYEMSEDMQKQ